MTENNILCAICLESILETNSCITKCGHKFCLSCILVSSKYKNACPSCREKIFEDEEYEDNNEETENQDNNINNQIVESVQVIQNIRYLRNLIRIFYFEELTYLSKITLFGAFVSFGSTIGIYCGAAVIYIINKKLF